jgi:hypothetical protein
MSPKQWFSTKVRLACLSEKKGLLRHNDSIYVFQCRDFDDAFLKALELGKSQETSYLNADQELINWRLKEIVSLDVIATEWLYAGAEVYSEPVQPQAGERIPFDFEFHPEDSRPTQTI